jgi:hypothetical protein
MLIDPLNIFAEIKEVLLEYIKVPIELYAIGSRAKGHSSGGTWDFDVLIISENELDAININTFLKEKFKNKIDENNRLLRIDAFCMTSENKIKYEVTIKTYRHAHLL